MTESLGTFDQLLGILVIGLAVPIATSVKDKLANWARPEFIQMLIAVGGAFGICALLSCGLTAEVLIEKALQAMGVATIPYGVIRIAKKKKP